MEKFYKDLKAAALLPTIALVVFSIVSVVIFTIVVPLFASLFSSAHAKIPKSTQFVIQISNFLLSDSVWWLLSGLILGLFFLYVIFRQAFLRTFFDKLLLYVPIASTIVKGKFRVTFLSSFAILSESGVHAVYALRTIASGIDNTAIKKEVNGAIDSVAAGGALSDELAKCSYNLFSEEIISLIAVGQESGRLQALLLQAASLAQDNVARYLSLCVTLFQPIFIVVLGVLIVLLICAVYLTIFNLSQVIM